MTSASAPSRPSSASWPPDAWATTSKPSSVSIEVSIARTWSVSSTTMTRIGRGIGPEGYFPDRSEASCHPVASEPAGAPHRQPEGHAPYHRPDGQRDRQRDEEQAGRLADGQEDEGQDHGPAELVRLL